MDVGETAQNTRWQMKCMTLIELFHANARIKRRCARTQHRQNMSVLCWLPAS